MSPKFAISISSYLVLALEIFFVGVCLELKSLPHSWASWKRNRQKEQKTNWSKILHKLQLLAHTHSGKILLLKRNDSWSYPFLPIVTYYLTSSRGQCCFVGVFRTVWKLNITANFLFGHFKSKHVFSFCLTEHYFLFYLIPVRYLV